MARTINEMAKDRRKAIASLKRELKQVNTILDRSIRRLDSISRRRTKIPDLQDLDKLTQDYQEMMVQLDDYTKLISDSMNVFVLI